MYNTTCQCMIEPSNSFLVLLLWSKVKLNCTFISKLTTHNLRLWLPFHRRWWFPGWSVVGSACTHGRRSPLWTASNAQGCKLQRRHQSAVTHGRSSVSLLEIIIPNLATIGWTGWGQMCMYLSVMIYRIWNEIFFKSSNPVGCKKILNLVEYQPNKAGCYVWCTRLIFGSIGKILTVS